MMSFSDATIEARQEGGAYGNQESMRAESSRSGLLINGKLPLFREKLN